MKKYNFYDIRGLNKYIMTVKNFDCPPHNTINNDSTDINQINTIDKNKEK